MADSTSASAAPAAEIPRTKEKLDELTSAASLQYSLKNFAAAADHYADASEIQAELNGEMAPENAELLFYYGRALYKVAMQKSDVLGTKVAQEEKKKPKSEKQTKKEAGESSNAAANSTTANKEESVDSKPFFQLTGDENWTDSEDDEDAEEGEGEAQEEEDDFQNAYETFEMARVLYEKQLAAIGPGDSADKGKGKQELTPEARAIKEKLGDCHSFLAEISLENERFSDAVADARKSLAIQEELHSVEHEAVAEAHFILSLALEMASVQKNRVDQVGIETGDSADAAEPNKEQEQEEIDWDVRNEAAEQTELAIQSVEARLKKEEDALAKPDLSADQKKEKEAIIKDKTQALEDLKNRVADLKIDPKSQNFDSIDSSVFQGILGGLLGADAATQKAKLEEVTKSANDISGLVKTKKKPKAPVVAAATSSDASSSKRKLEVENDNANGKRAKTEETQ